MCVYAIQWAYEAPTDHYTDRYVLVTLADYLGKEGRIFPKLSTLAAKCLLTERGVQKCLNRLVDKGLLHIERGGGRVSSEYHLVGFVPPVRPSGEPGSPEPTREPLEDGGGGSAPEPRSSAEIMPLRPPIPHSLRDGVLRAAGADPATQRDPRTGNWLWKPSDEAMVRSWLKRGLNEAEIVGIAQDTMKHKPGCERRCLSVLGYLDPAMRREAAGKMPSRDETVPMTLYPSKASMNAQTRPPMTSTKRTKSHGNDAWDELFTDLAVAGPAPADRLRALL